MLSFVDAPYALYAHRITLRPPQHSDTQAITQLANNPKIAAMTATIPHPYPLSAAMEWVKAVAIQRQNGQTLAYLICNRNNENVMGVISLKTLSDGATNLAYWLGEPYWGCGFCTEAGHLILKLAKQLNLTKIVAKHLDTNQPSKKVLLRLGFKEIRTEKSNHRGEEMCFVCYELSVDSD